MALSRIGAIYTPAPRRLLVRLGLAARPAAGYHSRKPFRTCFCGVAKSSMFAEMPLDNRTVDQFAALAAIAGSLRPYQALPRAKRRNVSPWLAVL
jgi:hypothetical protein